jgi:hypothetical protein
MVYCLGAPAASGARSPDFAWLPVNLAGIPSDPVTRYYGAEGNRMGAERIWKTRGRSMQM